MQKQNQVQRIDDLGAGNVLLVRHREHHVQEIGDVDQLGVGIDERKAHRAAIRIGCDGPDLADQPRGLLVKLAFLGRGLGLVAPPREAGEGVDHGRKNRHGRGIDQKPFKVMLEGLMEGA